MFFLLSFIFYPLLFSSNIFTFPHAIAIYWGPTVYILWFQCVSFISLVVSTSFYFTLHNTLNVYLWFVNGKISLFFMSEWYITISLQFTYHWTLKEFPCLLANMNNAAMNTGCRCFFKFVFSFSLGTQLIHILGHFWLFLGSLVLCFHFIFFLLAFYFG